MRTQNDDQAKDSDEHGAQLRHHSGARECERAEGKVAADREHEDAERSQRGAGNMVGAKHQKYIM